MTAKELEQGKQLTVHNATKEQLKWLCKDKESQANRLYQELQKTKKELEKNATILLSFMTYIMDNFGEEHLKKAMEMAK
jgi:hypothetical protein